MIDWLFILILVLAIALIIVQDQLIKRKNRLISEYEKLMYRVEPILAMVVAAQEAVKQSQPKPEQPKVH